MTQSSQTASVQGTEGATPSVGGHAPEVRDARKRELTGLLGKLVFAVGALGSAFHLYVLMVHPIQPWHLRAIHLMLTASLTFCLLPARPSRRERGPSLVDVLLVLAAGSGAIYLMYDFQGVLYRVGIEANTYDVIFATITFLVILEMGRRLQGYILPILAVLSLAYALFGDLFPGLWGHRGYPYSRAITFLYSLDGIYSEPLAASATFVILFILFGTFLNASGAGRFFIDTALSIAGGARGGPAKVAVLASSLFGTVSGSAVSNVVTTGTFTIPLMKQVGYRPLFAGAVEAVASTGGQLMPPVMSATAFVMAEVTGISYLRIAAAGLIPALLYFTAVFLMIGIEAKNLGLSGLPRDQLPGLGDVLRRNGHLLAPIFTLIYFLVIVRFSPMKSAYFALIAALIVSWVRVETRMGFREITQALNRGMVAVMDVAAPCALAGVVVGVMSLTGIGLKFSDLLLSYVGNSKLLALFAVMVVSLILGMGVPTLAAYLIAAVTAGPALVKLGVPLLAAHMFIFYFAAISTITPPVAISAFAAAGLAGAKPMEVGVMAVRLGVAAFVVPYMFVYGPSLLMEGSWGEIGFNFLTAVLGVYALARCVLDRLIWAWRRVLLGAAALLLIRTGWTTDLLGLALFFIGAGGDLIRVLANFRVQRLGTTSE